MLRHLAKEVFPRLIRETFPTLSYVTSIFDMRKYEVMIKALKKSEVTFIYMPQSDVTRTK
jgi:hypothetical protein